MKNTLAHAIAGLVLGCSVSAHNAVAQIPPPPANEPAESKNPPATKAGNASSRQTPAAGGNQLTSGARLNAGGGSANSSSSSTSPRLPPLPPIPGMEPQDFEVVRTETAPLSPDQIRQLRRMIDETVKAEAEPLRSPKAVSYSLPVNLAPGATPPVVRVSPRHVTSIVFLDATGSPWPITGFAVGDAPRFDVKREGPSHALTAKGAFSYGETNVAVFLSALPTPVNVTLLSGQREVDTRVDLTIPSRGPLAAASAPLTRSPEQDPALLGFLDGVPPSEAKALRVTGGVANAWSYRGTLYLRTRLTVLSPSWKDSLSSSDGTAVYAMPDAPVVLVSVDGRVHNLRVSE